MAGAAPQQLNNVAYNGAFTFSRVRYAGPRFGRGGAAWAHDWPAADINLPRIIAFVSTARINTGRSNVFTLDDPEIFRHPILYVSEPGFWAVTPTEADKLGAWLRKGGFLILDDFEGRQLDNALAQIERAWPGLLPIEIGADHPIFDAFFHVEDIYVPHPLVAVTPVYYGLFEENDPGRRMVVLLNHNADLAEYWEWSDNGWFPVDLSSEAYKLGTNYIIFGLTH